MDRLCPVMERLVSPAPPFTAVDRTEGVTDRRATCVVGADQKGPWGQHTEGISARSSVPRLESSELTRGPPALLGIDEMVAHPDFPNHSVRLKQSKIATNEARALVGQLCDDTAKTYSGYLDIGEHKQLFLFFSESRSAAPTQDPLVLWLQGGPGCSSSSGFLMELGPCTIENEGKSTIRNQYSWTEKANIVFLDSPIETGFSRGEKLLSNSQEVAEDLYAFIQLFYRKFPELSKNKFHIAGESYAGIYIPNAASIILHKNKLLNGANSNAVKVPLVSMVIGNGITDPYYQYGSYHDFLCGGGGRKPNLDNKACAALKPVITKCQKRVSTCYKHPSPTACSTAEHVCDRLDGEPEIAPLSLDRSPSAPADVLLTSTSLEDPVYFLGLNPYDITKTCDRLPSKDGPYCYREIMWIERYLNQSSIKAELGVEPTANFQTCNYKVYQLFAAQGDIMRNAAALIPELLEEGIKMLIYVGTCSYDGRVIPKPLFAGGSLMLLTPASPLTQCNYIGNLEWTVALRWSGQANYKQAKLYDFKMPNGHVAGLTKTYKTMTYLRVYKAGHMVPHDKPAEALEMITRWLDGAAL
ncbi:BQ2448_5358 [Microbotryum intermedium]|uniref:Carboxypeptidase n=1 Tax=Microbotryum intermedium TaxID=269621 RepID=A0A238F3Y8_9BASI|nr:BQ2448_5358 [Microbotryum intermedium]